MDLKEAEKLAKTLSGNYWNYRWIKVVDEWDAKNLEGEMKHYTEVIYELREVYYDTKDKPFMYSENPARMIADNYEDLMRLLGSSLSAAKEPVLLLKDGELIETEEYMEGL